MILAAVQKLSLAGSIMGITNAPLQLVTWYLVRGRVINMCTYCVHIFVFVAYKLAVITMAAILEF